MSFGNSNPRCKIFQTPINGGPGPARNFGVQKASGKYIIFSDSDDFFDISCLKKLDKFLQENSDAEMVVSPYSVKRGEEQYKDDSYKKYKNGDEIKIADVVIGNNGPVCKVLIRELIEKNGLTFPARMTGEDAVFVVNYASYIKKAYKFDEVYYTYIMNDSSVTHTYKSSLDEPTTFEILYEVYHEKFPEIETYCFVTAHLLTKAKTMCSLGVSNKEIKKFFEKENKRYPNWINEVDYENQSTYRKLIFKAMYKNIPWLIKFVLFLRKILY
jgi:glycosyltransferase involved in cell wall biosynthesis